MVTFIICAVIFSVIFSFINCKQKPDNKTTANIFYGILGGLFSGAVFGVVFSLIIGLFYPKISSGEKESAVLPVVNQGVFIGDHEVGNVLLIFDGGYYFFSYEDKDFKVNNNAKVYKESFQLKVSENDDISFVRVTEKYILADWINWFIISKKFGESSIVTYEVTVPENKILYIKKS